MQSTTRVALDAMGGDNAPAEVVKGAVDAVNKRNDIKIFLVGQKVPVIICFFFVFGCKSTVFL